MGEMAKMEKTANMFSNRSNNTSQLTTRSIFMALAGAAPSYPTIVSPPDLTVLPRAYRNSVPFTDSSVSSSSSSVFKCTGNPNHCVDLFFKVARPSKYEDRHKLKIRKISEVEAEVENSCACLKQLLPLAWSNNPLTTLQLIFNLQYYYEEAFYTAACWLHHNYPKTLLYNVPSIAMWPRYGNMRELVKILYRLLEGKDGRREKEKKMVAKEGVERYECDPDYKLLHDRVTNIYVECLKSDLEK